MLIMHATIFFITTLELWIKYHQFIPGFEMVYASLIFEIIIISYMTGNKWIENWWKLYKLKYKWVNNYFSKYNTTDLSIRVMSYCKFWIYWVGVNTKFVILQICIYTHPVNSKFTMTVN